jgi:hypothetical protein
MPVQHLVDEAEGGDSANPCGSLPAPDFTLNQDS